MLMERLLNMAFNWIVVLTVPLWGPFVVWAMFFEHAAVAHSLFTGNMRITKSFTVK